MGQGRIWITRSEPGASRLALTLQRSGYSAWVGPVLQIHPLSANTQTHSLTHGGSWEPSTAQIVVVLSEHVVRHGQQLPWQSWVDACSQIFAVGDRTAQALNERGVRAQAPGVASSEGLLNEFLGTAAVSGRRVLLLAGLGGRDTLRQKLSTRGANIAEMSLYRRVARQQLVVPAATINAISVSSGDGLRAAHRLWQQVSRRIDIPVYAPSQRVVELARGIGWNNAYNCHGAGSAALLSALAEHG